MVLNGLTMIISLSDTLKLFDILSETLVWIAEHNYSITKMLHLLDDFFLSWTRLQRMDYEHMLSYIFYSTNLRCLCLLRRQSVMYKKLIT